MSYIRMNGALFNAEDVIGVYAVEVDDKIKVHANLSNGATFCIGTYPLDAAVDGILSTVQQQLDKDADIREAKHVRMEVEANNNVARKEAEIARREELANATMENAQNHERALQFREDKLHIQRSLLEKEKQAFAQRVSESAGVSPYELVLDHPNFDNEVHARTDGRRAWAFNCLTVRSNLATFLTLRKFKDMRRRAIRATRGIRDKKKRVIEPLNLAIKALEKQVAAPRKIKWQQGLGTYTDTCPCCNEGVAEDWLYCSNCGQKLRRRM